MYMRPGEEFRIQATPSPELLRKLAYLAAQDNGSVLTGGIRSGSLAYRSAEDARKRSRALMHMALMADPAYRELYERVGDKLDRADRASLAALEDARQRAAEAREALEALHRRAALLPDGRRVYRTQDEAAAYDEDGNRLTGREMGGVEWRDGQPTWEGEIEQRDRLREAVREVEDIEAYRRHLEEQQERHGEGDLSPDELKELDRSLDAAMPAAVRWRYEADPAAVGQTPAADRAEASVPRTGSAATYIDSEGGLSATAPARAAFAPAANGMLTAEEIEELAAPPAAPAVPQVR